jgi:CubicO group peptidase (beta-lactamase class C family)
MANSALQVACASLVLISGIAHPQTHSTAASRASLARQMHDTMSTLLTAAVADRAFPGAYAVVGDSAGVLAEVGVGHLDWDPSPVPDRHTLWDLASLTKVVATTTAIAQLVEQGKLELDAPVQRYLPDWTGPGKQLVTVRHLLTHSSGLPAFKPYDQQTHNRDTLAMLLFATPLDTTPGAQMVYSDIGAFMLGRLVERVSGERLDQYVSAHVLRPLRMKETMYNPPRSLLARVAPTEIDTLRGGLVVGFVHDERAYYLGGVAAHAGLFSSGADMARFAAMLLHHGTLDGARVLDSLTLDRFTAYQDSAFSNRALGWQKPPVSWAGTLMSSHAFGHTGFTGTSIAVDPDRKLFIILLTNRVNPTRNNPKISDVRARLTDAIISTLNLFTPPPTGGSQ